MAHDVTGNALFDCESILQLARGALQMAAKTGAKKFACKVYQGEGIDEFLAAVREVYVRVKVYKPSASRKASREVYIVGMTRL